MLNSYQHLREKLLSAALSFAKGKASEERLDAQLFPSIHHFSTEQVKKLSEIIGLPIRHPQYFEQAFLHSSYAHKRADGSSLSNERMEFLGDAILGFVVAEYIFHLHDDFTEGDLTKFRANLVNKKALSFCAERLGIMEFLIADRGVYLSLSNNQQTSVLADLMESLIAAIYFDSGMIRTREFIVRKVISPIIEHEQQIITTNYKSKLQEELQGKGQPHPHYEVISESGPSHNKHFVVAVYCAHTELGRGSGSNKKDASQAAAQDALARLMNSIPASDEMNNL